MHSNAFFFFTTISAKEVGGLQGNDTAILMLSEYTVSFGRTGDNSQDLYKILHFLATYKAHLCIC